MEFTPIDSFSPPKEISLKPRVIEIMIGVGVVSIGIAVLIIAINYTQKNKVDNRL
jgi:Ni/Fe-hydrogenase subunit HybB-like protein